MRARARPGITCSAGLALAAWIALLGPAIAQETGEVRVMLAIEHGAVAEPSRTIRVKKNDRVRLVVTADQPTVIHLHGYKLEASAGPGAAGEMAFVAHATGRFPIHLHAAGESTPGHRHGAAIAYLEVRPR